MRRAAWAWAAGAVLLVLGMVWATARQPHRVVDFRLKGEGWRGVPGVAVVPRVEGKLPVVIYLHGSGDALERSTGTLRQFAELGIAAVYMDYTQTNAASFPAEFEALCSWVASQAWAETNRVAWVGFSLGAQRMLTYLLAEPARAPKFLVRLGGGTVPELAKAQSGQLTLPVWLLHGGEDQAFPLAELRQTEMDLRRVGAGVTTTVLPGQTHAFGESRALVHRLIAERCRSELAAGRHASSP